MRDLHTPHQVSTREEPRLSDSLASSHLRMSVRRGIALVANSNKTRARTEDVAISRG